MDEVNILHLKCAFPDETRSENLVFASSISKDVYLNFDEQPGLSIEVLHALWFNYAIQYPEAGLFEFTDIIAGKRITNTLLCAQFMIKFGQFGDTYLAVAPNILHYTKNIIVNMDGYTLSLFLKCMSFSRNYIKLVTNNFPNMSYQFCRVVGGKIKVNFLSLKINWKDPLEHPMDLTWAKMACTKIYELRQLQYTMSWLSTLGGAFSALGEEQEKCVYQIPSLQRPAYSVNFKIARLIM